MKRLSVVIARHNEDVAWLKTFNELSGEYDITLYVYDKDDSQNATLTESSVRNSLVGPKLVYKQLRNVGRESYSYLYHIVEHYDECVAEQQENGQQHRHMILFLQGRIDDHAKADIAKDEQSKIYARLKFLRARIDDANKHGLSRTISSQEHRGSFYHQRTRRYKGLVSPADAPFGPWFEKLLNITAPNTIYWIPGAMFAIHSQHVLYRSKEFYERLTQDASTSINPEVAYHLERAWLYIFNGSDVTMHNK